jgi:hypothetical protein
MWKEKPFNRGQAWIDMILLANHKEGQVRARGIPIKILRGQLGWSKVALAERWGWSRGKVTRFFDELEIEQQIEQQNNNVTSLITIINYEKYQGDGQQIVQQTDSKRTANGQQTDTNNKDKKLKNEKKTYMTPLLGEHKNVKVTDKEFVDLKAYVGSESVALDLIDRLSLYLASSGNTYANHYATMQTWYRKDKDKADNSNGAVVRETF